MKKSLRNILILIILTVPVFLMSYSPRQPEKATINNIAPDISFRVNDSSFKLSAMKGKQVLLTFWSKEDPASRINNIRAAQNARKDSQTIYLSVCTDSIDQDLSREIARLDNAQSQTIITLSQIPDTTQLTPYIANGNSSYTISPEGIIAAQTR